MNSSDPNPKPAASETNGVSPSNDETIAKPISPKTDARPGEPPAGIIPGYQINREIAQGGQGIVFDAIHEATGRRIALKLLFGSATSQRDRARFDREVQILASLQHPNIIDIIDRGTLPDGSFYLAMPYIAGRPLDAWMAVHNERVSERTGREALGQVLKVFLKVCDAVNAAHLRGVVHRDLKPNNIIVDDHDEPHILDFGLAKTAFEPSNSGPMTMTGQFLGSLPWASPEQADGNAASLDVRSDVYSLGVILYQMLTGTFPYEVAGNMRDILNNIATVKPPPPSSVLTTAMKQATQPKTKSYKNRHRPKSELNATIDAIVLKALAKRREDRYQNAGELAQEIERYLAGKPVMAEGGATTARTAKMRTWVGIGGMLVLLLIAFVALSKSTPVETTLNLPSIKPADAASPPAAAPVTPQSSPNPSNISADQQRITTLLDQARSKDNVKQGRTALSLLDDLLKLDPSNPEAISLQAKISKYYPPAAIGDRWANSVGMKFTYIPAGEFLMGGDQAPEIVAGLGGGEAVWYQVEHPRARVRITRPFLMGTTEITQRQYKAVMGENPSFFSGDESLPVESVSWDDAVAFCKKLSEKENVEYRLPTEAEWEYACRAGSTTPFSTGETIGTDEANYHGEYVYANGRPGANRRKPTPSGNFPPNRWGLYDMHGNVWEWCADWYGKYSATPNENPSGPTLGKTRITRGGSWENNPWHCRSAYRDATSSPAVRKITIGFRVVCVLSSLSMKPDNAGPSTPETQPALAGPPPWANSADGLDFRSLPFRKGWIDYLRANDSAYVVAHGPEFDDDTAAAISRMPKLSDLVMIKTQITGAGLKKILIANPQLNSLQIEPTPIAKLNRPFHGLKMPQLRSIIVIGPVTPEDMWDLKLSAPNLVGIVIRDGAEPGVIESLSNLDSLGDITLEMNVTVDFSNLDASGLRRLQKLRRIAIKRLKNAGAVIKVLPDLPEITKATFPYTDVTDADVPALAACKKLEDVSLEFTLITSKSLPLLQNIKPLKYLHISSKNMTPGAIAEFARNRPDVALRVDGVIYEPKSTGTAVTTTQPKVSASAIIAPTSSKPEPAAPLPDGAFEWTLSDTSPAAAELGAPFSLAALVTEPMKLPGVKSWTVETTPARGYPRPAGVELSASGRLLAVGGGDRCIRVYERQPDKRWKVISILMGHRLPIRSIALSPDGRTLVSCDGLSEALIWDWPLATLRRRINCEVLGTRGGSANEYRVAVSSDGTQVAIAGAEVWIIDAKTGKQTHSIPSGGVEPAWSPEGSKLAWRDPQTGRVCIYETTNFTRIFEDGEQPSQKPNAPPLSRPGVVWSGDGKWLAWARSDQLIVSWSSESFRAERKYITQKSAAFALSTTGDVLLTNENGFVNVYADKFETPTKTIIGDDESRLQYLRDTVLGKVHYDLITSSLFHVQRRPGMLRGVDNEALVEYPELCGPGYSALEGIAFSGSRELLSRSVPDSQKISRYGRWKIDEAGLAVPVFQRSLPALRDDGVEGWFELQVAGDHFRIGDNLFDIATGQVPWPLPEPVLRSRNRQPMVAFSGDGKYAAFADANKNEVRIWDLQANKLVATLAAGSDVPICQPAWNASGDAVAVLSEKKILQWNRSSTSSDSWNPTPSSKSIQTERNSKVGYKYNFQYLAQGTSGSQWLAWGQFGFTAVTRDGAVVNWLGQVPSIQMVVPLSAGRFVTVDVDGFANFMDDSLKRLNSDLGFGGRLSFAAVAKPNNRETVATAGMDDGLIRLFDAQRMVPFASLVQLDDIRWVSVTSDGRRMRCSKAMKDDLRVVIEGEDGSRSLMTVDAFLARFAPKSGTAASPPP